MTETRTRDQTTTAGVRMQDAGMPAGQAPARRGPQTEVERAKAVAVEAREKMLEDVESNRAEIIRFLSAFGIDYEFFLAGLKTFLMRQMQDRPDFFTKVTASSFMEALFRCAKDGLIPDGKEAAIGHFKPKDSARSVATYMPMRDGFVKVLWRTGMVKSINDNVVTRPEYEAKRFRYVEGDNGFIEHEPDMERKDSDDTMAAYCVVQLMTGGAIREVVPKADLDKIAKMSKSPARGDWKFQMDRKAAIRRVMGKMPREKGIAQLLAHDDMNYDSTQLIGHHEDGALPRAAVFSNKVHRRARPAPPQEIEPQKEESTPDPDLNEAAEIEVEEETGAGAAAGDFVLQAILSTKNGLQMFAPAEAEFWEGDLRNKMRELAKGDREVLEAFWAKNHGYIEAAGRNGFGPQAMKLVDLATELGLIGGGDGQR